MSLLSTFLLNVFKKKISLKNLRLIYTSLALTVLYDVLKSDLSNAQKRYLVNKFDTVLSLDLTEKVASLDSELVKYIEEKIEERKLAKQNKDFALADHIRDELLERGVIIKDTREGTVYEIR